MNKQAILSTSCATLLLLTACSGDNNAVDDGQVNAAKSIEFKVNFSDYNAEQNLDVTRSKSKENKEVKLEQKAIDLGNGVLALCTLQRDTTGKAKAIRTRFLENDTYTMLAYESGTHILKGELTGTVTSGIFTPTSTNPSIILMPGTYDFVLYNSKVTRSGNTLTVTRANADAAVIGRTTQTITASPVKQYVPFTMKHAGALVQIHVVTYMDSTNANIAAKIESVNSTDVPGSAIYDASTGTWAAGAGAAMSANSTYKETGPWGNPSWSQRFGARSKNIPFVATTDVSKLKLTFTSGNIYNTNIANVSIAFNPASTLKLDQNGYYTLRVRLLYRYPYLMSDGTVGTTEETTYGGGTKTPIAVILSRSKHIGIALHNANNEETIVWCNSVYSTTQTNTYDTSYPFPLTSSVTSGLDETWDAGYTHSNVTGEKVKGKNPDFPAFKAAADYDPGVAYTGSPALKWFLPSSKDFVDVFSVLGNGNVAEFATATYPMGPNWDGGLADVPFLQVYGTSVVIDSKQLWTSSETDSGWFAKSVAPYGDMIVWTNFSKSFPSVYVRPFVKY